MKKKPSIKAPNDRPAIARFKRHLAAGHLDAAHDAAASIWDDDERRASYADLFDAALHAGHLGAAKIFATFAGIEFGDGGLGLCGHQAMLRGDALTALQVRRDQGQALTLPYLDEVLDWERKARGRADASPFARTLARCRAVWKNIQMTCVDHLEDAGADNVPRLSHFREVSQLAAFAGEVARVAALPAHSRDDADLLILEVGVALGAAVAS